MYIQMKAVTYTEGMEGDKMEHYLIATHGELSKELIETAKLIVGDIGKVDYFCMTKEKSSSTAESEIREIVSAVDTDNHLIVLTDIFGGSVANIFTTLLMEGATFELVTGVNLPMVLSLLLSPEKDTKEKIIKTIADAKEGIRYVNEVIEAQTVEEDDLDDFLS